MDNPILLHQAIAIIDRFPDATRHALTQAHRDELLALLHVVEVAGREAELNTLRVAVETIFALGYEAGRGATTTPAEPDEATEEADKDRGEEVDEGEDEAGDEEDEEVDELSARRRQRETPDENQDTPTDFE